MVKDKFLLDDEEKGSAQIFKEVLNDGKVSVVNNEHIMSKEGDLELGSLHFVGTVPGATSRDKSEDPNFTEITDGTKPAGTAFSKEEHKKRQDESNIRYLQDPIYTGLVDAFKFFVIGQGIKVAALDESQEVQDYLKLFDKVNKMDGRDRDIIAKSLKSGELFIRKFTKGPKGFAAKIPTIRFLNYYDITHIEKDPNDNEKVISYTRSFRDENLDIKTEKIPADEIIHIKFASLDDLRGLPPFMSIMQHCFYYSDWLKNRIVLNRAKTSYYLEEIVKGTPSNVGTVDSATPNSNKVGLGGKVIKRMPKPGSKLTHNESVEYKWLSPDVKADDAKEDGRAIRMAICAGAQCPEFILGDASEANFVSTLVSQNPFVRKIEWLQDFFEAYFHELYEWIIRYGIDNKMIPVNSTETVMKEKAAGVGWFRRFKKMFDVNEQFDPSGNIVVKKKVPTKTEVSIQWPPIIASDLLKETQAYQLHQNMGIVSDQTISQKLGYDFEEEMRLREKEESNREEPPEEEPLAGKKRDDEISRKEDEEDENGSKGGGGGA